MRLPSKTGYLLFTSLLIGRTMGQGDDGSPFRADFGYVSSYVFRGVERAGQSAQASVEFNRSGFRGGVSLNRAFDSGDPGELNLSAGYGWETSGGVTLEATVTHAWFRNVPGVDRSLEAGFVVTLVPTGGFTPSLGYYRDFRFDADTAQVSFARSVALTKLGAFLELNLFAGLVRGDDWRPDSVGPRQRDGYGYWGGEARLPYRIGPHSTVVAGLHYADSFGRSIPSGPFGGPPRGKLWISLGVNLDF